MHQLLPMPFIKGGCGALARGDKLKVTIIGEVALQYHHQQQS